MKIITFITKAILISIICTTGFTQETPQFVKIKTKLKKDQSLAKLFSKFLKEDAIVRKSSPMTKKTFEANPKIKNWKKLKKDTSIILYLNKAYIDPKKMAEFKKSIKKKKKKVEAKKFGAFISGGTVKITDEDDNTLDFNLFKVGINYYNKFNQDYKYQVSLSTVSFSSLDYSEANETADYNNFLPEFNFSIWKNINEKFSLGAGYDYLNYFVLKDASSTKFNLDPEEIHRINVKPTLKINPKYSLLSSLGYLTGAGSGFDASVGVNANFNLKSKLQPSAALIGYYSSLDVDDRKETSNAFLLSFSVKI